MAPTPADRAALWLLSVAVVGVGANLLATAIAEEWRWVTYFIYSTIALVVVATLPGGFFHRSRYGPTILGRSVAGVTLIAYIAASVFLVSTNALASIAGIGLLWSATVLLTWNTLRTRVPINDAAVGVALLFAGSAFLIGGVNQAVAAGWSGWREGVTSNFANIGTALLGIASFASAIAFLRGRYSMLGVIVGVSGLLGGLASVPVASAYLSSGALLLGAAGLLFGSASCMVGIASLFRIAATLEAAVPLGVAGLFYGFASILFGIAHLDGQVALFGIAGFFFGTTGLAFGATILVQRTTRPTGWSRSSLLTLGGISFILLGVAYLNYDTDLVLVATMLLLCGIAIALRGVVELRASWEAYREAFSQGIRLILDRDEPSGHHGPGGQRGPGDDG